MIYQIGNKVLVLLSGAKVIWKVKVQNWIKLREYENFIEIESEK